MIFTINEYKKQKRAFYPVDDKYSVSVDEVVFFEHFIDADMACVFSRRGGSWNVHYSNGKNASPYGGPDLILIENREGDPDDAPDIKAPKFKIELAALINKHSKENGSDTPDFILAKYLNDCLKAFNKAMLLRTKHYDHGH